MQFKTLFAAFGLVAAATAAALPAAEAEVEVRANTVSAPFKIRRFTPLEGFDPKDEKTWSNNQYTNIAGVQQYFNYDGVAADKAYGWTLDTSNGYLRGSAAGGGGLAARNLQSFEITLTPIAFGGDGEVAYVTIGEGPLFEVTFNTVRGDKKVSGWNGLSQIAGNVFLGKASDIKNPIRFRAIGYVPPV